MTLLISCILVYHFQLSAWWYVASVVIFVGEIFLKDHFFGLVSHDLEAALVKHMKQIMVRPSPNSQGDDEILKHSRELLEKLKLKMPME